MEWKFPAKAAAQLQQQVQGTVVVSADAAYHSARQAFVHIGAHLAAAPGEPNPKSAQAAVVPIRLANWKNLT